MTTPADAIIQLGHPTLRQQAQPIDNPTAATVQTLIDKMLEAVQQSKGVGLAAPQVGESLQLLVVASRPSERYPDAPQMEPLPLINPMVVSHSSIQEKGWEGCLSVPGIRGLVPRYTWVEVEYLDRQGQPQRMTFQDFVDRIFQHEWDHLIGKVFLDRVESTTELMTEQEWRKQFPAP